MPAKEPDTDPLVGTKYEKIKFINSGSFGYVVLARNKETSAEVAIKFVEVSTEKDVKHRCGSTLHPRRVVCFAHRFAQALTTAPLSNPLEPILPRQPTRDHEPSAASAPPRCQADGGFPRRRLSRHRTSITPSHRLATLPTTCCPHLYPARLLIAGHGVCSGRRHVQPRGDQAWAP